MNLRINHILLSAILLSGFLVLTSCNGRPKNVLSKSEMTDFLFDLHKLDGVLAIKGLGSAQDRENLYYYNALLLKHGITEAQFDSSLAWYSKNPKSFEKIYTVVLDRMNEFDSIQKLENLQLEKLKSYQETSYNIWNNRTTLSYNKDSVKGLPFVIKYQNFFEKDVYKLSLRIRSAGKLKDQFVLIRIHYHDGKRDSVKAKIYSDSIFRKYTIRLKAKRNIKIDSLSGVICKTNDRGKTFTTKADSISLFRFYKPAVQDSLVKLNEMQNVPLITNPENKPQPTLRVRVLEYRKKTKNSQPMQPLFGR